MRNHNLIHLFNLLVFGVLFLVACGTQTEEKITYYDGTKNKNVVANYLKENSSVKHGIYKAFYQNGKIKEELDYDQGRLKEVIGVYSMTGETLQTKSIKNGTGEYLQLNNLGQKIAELNYKNGVLDGISKYYSIDGQMVAQINYKNDKVIEVSTDGQFTSSDNDNQETSDTSKSKPKKEITVSGFDPQTANAILNKLKVAQYDAMYNASFSKLKQTQSLGDMRRYLAYLRELYGDLQNYTLESYDLKNQAGVGEALQIIYQAQFRYCKGQILLALARENGEFKLAGLDIAAAPFTPIAQVTRLCNPILERIKTKDYEGLYKLTSSRFKAEVPHDKYTLMMKELSNKGDLTQYQLSEHRVGLVDKKLVLIAYYEIKVGSTELIMTLNFMEENGQQALQGFGIEAP